MEEDPVVKMKPSSSFPSPTIWLTKFISLQADIFLNCLLALFSPLFSILSLLCSLEQTKENPEFAAHMAAGAPKKARNGIFLLMKKLGLGILAAAYVGMILTFLLIVSFMIGFGLVHYWVEEPMNLRERLHFDYSMVNPEAILSFDEDLYSFNGGSQIEYDHYMKSDGVPVGHTFYVSVVLLLPESDYNREVGVFQLNTELIMSNGVVMAKGTHPCMLRYSSWPVRLMRTFTMAIPLVLGIKSETKTLIVPMIKHKEGFPRTDSIRVTMVPRAGTNYIPQVYESELILKSKPPWKYELVRRWRWTISVWTSFCIYSMALLVMLVSFRQIVLPIMTRDFGNNLEEYSKKMEEERLRLWDIDQVVEYVGSSSSSLSSSFSVTQGDDDTCNKSTMDEEIEDSESVCNVSNKL